MAPALFLAVLSLVPLRSDDNSSLHAPYGDMQTRSGYPLSYSKDAPNLPSKIALCTEDEPGERMVISGTVYEEDGVTPVARALVYLYQTDARGVYSVEKENDTRPKLRGYLKTDANGRYEIRSIKPGHYPHIKAGIHIHVHVESQGQPEYGDAFWFANDPILHASQVAELEKQQQDFGLVELKPDSSGVLHGVHNIKPAPDIAKYAAALLAAKTPLDTELARVNQLVQRGWLTKELADPLVAAMKAEAAEVPNDALERELRNLLTRSIGIFVEFRPHRFIYTSDAGNIETERKFPAGTGPQHPLETRTNEMMDFRLHEHGDTAVLSWLDVSRVQMKDQRFSTSDRETAVFVKRGDKWQLISWQISPVGFERVAARVPPKVLDAYGGRYEHPMWGTYYVSREGDMLVFTSANGYRTEYLPESETEFFEKDEAARKRKLQTVTFVRNDRGRVTHCVFRENDGQNILVKKTK